MWTKVLILSIASLSYTTFSQANCNVRSLNLDVISEQTNYDILAAGNYTVTNTYRVSAAFEGTECQAKISIDLDEGELSLKGHNGNELQFDWHGGSGYQQANQWQITLNEEQPSATFQMRYPSLQWLDAGHYSGNLEATIVGGNLASLTSIPSKSTSIDIKVLPVAKIQFYGLAQSHYDLDMGSLYSNKQIHSAPKLWVKTNTGYSVTIESANQGMLRHQSDDSKWDIDYEMLFNQTRVDLNQANATIQRHTPTSGHPIPLKFAIGNTENKPGGTYSDTLQISIEPRLSQQP
ncbi:hypothetical protein [Vibrio atypicus]|uniref:hypothetical protein n=1 Tax=Vibrio atypicus TaxID=558271 RepID=UPI001358116B|nr:hypothetical protein [Vibrio atypicus]